LIRHRPRPTRHRGCGGGGASRTPFGVATVFTFDHQAFGPGDRMLTGRMLIGAVAITGC